MSRSQSRARTRHPGKQHVGSLVRTSSANRGGGSCFGTRIGDPTPTTVPCTSSTTTHRHVIPVNPVSPAGPTRVPRRVSAMICRASPAATGPYPSSCPGSWANPRYVASGRVRFTVTARPARGTRARPAPVHRQDIRPTRLRPNTRPLRSARRPPRRQRRQRPPRGGSAASAAGSSAARAAAWARCRVRSSGSPEASTSPSRRCPRVRHPPGVSGQGWRQGCARGAGDEGVRPKLIEGARIPGGACGLRGFGEAVPYRGRRLHGQLGGDRGGTVQIRLAPHAPRARALFARRAAASASIAAMAAAMAARSCGSVIRTIGGSPRPGCD